MKHINQRQASLACSRNTMKTTSKEHLQRDACLRACNDYLPLHDTCVRPYFRAATQG